MPNAPFSLKLYRWLLKLYPVAFREEYGAPMEREFYDELAESNGFLPRAVFWIQLLADLAITAPLQVSREVWRDARHTLRLWANRPWQIAFSIVALAIGIGGNMGVFSVVNTLLLRSLPFREPSRLASLRTYLVPHDSAQQFHTWRRQSSYLADAALSEEADFNVGGVGNTERAHVAQTSWNFFSILGTQPVLGRGFNSGEDTPGRNSVAVIGYGLWQQLFAGDERVLGSKIRLNGMPLTIIGVAPPAFDYPHHTLLWKAAQFNPGNNGWDTTARLKPGVTWPQARAAFTAEMERLSPDHRINVKFPPAMAPLRDELAGPVKNASLLLMAGVVLILLIACTNVANLVLARTADRAGELAIRSALGASRARLAQQLLTECLLLALAGAAAGLLVAFWTTSIAAKLEPAPLATQSYGILDWRVLAFGVSVTILSGLLFGLLPGRGNSRLIRETLVAAQVTLTVVLLTASVSVGRAFINLMHLDRGFDVRGLVTVSVSLDGTTHDSSGRPLAYFEEALARIRRLPGVQSASATEYLPLYATGFVGGPWGMDGRPAKASSMTVPVMSGYFHVMGGQLLYGREFTDAEVRSGAQVAVVNDLFASEFGAPADAVGHQLTIGNDRPLRIIGVAKQMDYMSLGGNSSQVFTPANAPGGFSPTFVVRVDGRAEDHVAMIRDAIRSVDPRVPVFAAKTMEQHLEDALARPKFYRTAVLVFAAFALLLALIGIYGVVSYAVAQRTREMGVRLALGTTPVRLRRMLLRQGLLTIAVGAIAGVAAATVTGRFLESLVEGAKSIDFATFSLSTLFLFLVASASIWSATRRIAGLDIMDILRVE